MASYRVLPENATLAEREAHASFVLLHLTLPILRRGQVLTDEGWDMFIGTASQVAGRGDGVDAAEIRSMLDGIRARR